MIVERWIVKAKQGLTSDLADLVSSECTLQRERGRYSSAYRIYIPQFGPGIDQVVLEWEWMDIAERDRFWSGWIQLPTTAEFQGKWGELVEPGWTQEIWNLRTP